ncbi:MAG: hypothetical protein NT062_23800 [Proteobacteria bacterium]|nr:hypothetical protein [Pseudomonadota bacterium]
MKSTSCALLCLLTPLVVACSDHAHTAEAFPTLQDCYADHTTGGEMLPHAEAITVCCIDHPIAGVAPSCGSSAAECVTHVDAELDATATPAEITAACDDYVVQLGI